MPYPYTIETLQCFDANRSRSVFQYDAQKVNWLCEAASTMRRVDRPVPMDGDRIICISPSEGLVSDRGYLERRDDLLTVCAQPSGIHMNEFTSDMGHGPCGCRAPVGSLSSWHGSTGGSTTTTTRAVATRRAVPPWGPCRPGTALQAVPPRQHRGTTTTRVVATRRAVPPWGPCRPGTALQAVPPRQPQGPSLRGEPCPRGVLVVLARLYRRFHGDNHKGRRYAASRAPVGSLSSWHGSTGGRQRQPQGSSLRGLPPDELCQSTRRDTTPVLIYKYINTLVHQLYRHRA